TSADETSTNALVTVRSYWTFASSHWATRTSYWFLSRPPWRSGPISPAAIDHFLPSGKRFETSVLIAPKAPVRLMVGKKFAAGTPTSALAAIRFCRASRTSGRGRRGSGGRPAGTSGGRKFSVRAAPRGIDAGFLPTRSDIVFSSDTIWLSSC